MQECSAAERNSEQDYHLLTLQRLNNMRLSNGMAGCWPLRNSFHEGVQAFVPRRFSQLSDATWDVGVLLLGEAVGLELGWLGVADLTGPQVLRCGQSSAAVIRVMCIGRRSDCSSVFAIMT